MLKRLRRIPSWSLILVYALILASLYLFAELAQGVYAEEGFAFDQAVLRWLFEQRRGWLTRLALSLDLFGISYFLGSVIVVAAALLWRRSKAAAVFMVAGFWGAVSVNLLTKAFFERSRPDLFEQLTPITNSSFPSGHAMGSWAFWLVTTVVAHRLFPRYAWPVGLVGAVFALAVGSSRTYLQVHYPSDVLAGWLLSSAWVLAMVLWYTRSPSGAHLPETAPLTADGSRESDRRASKE